MDAPCAIGRLGSDGPWLGFVAEGPEYRLAVGTERGVRSASASADLLLALAIAFFEDELDEPPPDLEATQADVSAMLRRVPVAGSPEGARLLDEAVDAVDDGLAVDEVISRLSATRRHLAEGAAEPLATLRDWAARLGAAG